MASSGAVKKPVYLRGIPADVIREAKAMAARRGVTLAGFVTEVLTRALDEQAAAPEPAGSFQKELRWFEQQRARLSRELPGEYVAIIGEAVVDHDPAFEQLAERVRALRRAQRVHAAGELGASARARALAAAQAAMTRTPFDESFDPPAPALPVHIGGIRKDGPAAVLRMLVDTGADCTLITGCRCRSTAQRVCSSRSGASSARVSDQSALSSIHSTSQW